MHHIVGISALQALMNQSAGFLVEDSHLAILILIASQDIASLMIITSFFHQNKFTLDGALEHLARVNLFIHKPPPPCHLSKRPRVFQRHTNRVRNTLYKRIHILNRYNLRTHIIL